MHQLTVTIAIVIALCLTHFSYVDFRFRHRGSVHVVLAGATRRRRFSWYRGWPSRLCLLSAIATAFIGASQADGDRHLLPAADPHRDPDHRRDSRRGLGAAAGIASRSARLSREARGGTLGALVI